MNRRSIDWNWLRKKVRLASHLGALATLLFCIAICLRILTTLDGGRSTYGTPDYAGFYVAATILNEDSPARLYDRSLQNETYHARFPAAPAEQSYPFAHIPAVAAAVRPLAHLEFPASYGLWLILMALLIAAGLAMTWSLLQVPRQEAISFTLLALAFPPLVMECWPSGQLSAVGLIAVAVSLKLLQQDREFLSGCVLSLCFYKPTLLMFALPILLLSRRWRLTAGLAVGGLVLGGLCLWIVGSDGAAGYYRMLTGYTETMSADAQDQGFKTFKHVDLNSFLTLLGGAGLVAKTVLVVTGAAFAVSTILSWWRQSPSQPHGLAAAMCATLTGNAIFSAYTPIYDASILIPNVAISLGIAYQYAQKTGDYRPRNWLLGAILLVFGSSWITQELARHTGFQPMTIALLALCAVQIRLALRLEKPSEPYRSCSGTVDRDIEQDGLIASE